MEEENNEMDKRKEKVKGKQNEMEKKLRENKEVEGKVKEKEVKISK